MAISQNPPHHRRSGGQANAGSNLSARDTPSANLPEDTAGTRTSDRLAAYARQLVDSFPPLTEEQRAQLAALMRGSLPEDIQPIHDRPEHEAA
jgi:hypothetical protein